MPGPTKPRVLVADDEGRIRDLVRGYLEAEGFEVDTAADGAEALNLARASNPDLVMLDVMMPGIDGIEVLRRLRTESDVYVIMLTARADEVDTLIGLSVGADDYVTKPFSPRELVARIKTVLRRGRGAVQEQASECLAFDGLTIDVARHEVVRDRRRDRTECTRVRPAGRARARSRTRVDTKPTAPSGLGLGLLR